MWLVCSVDWAAWDTYDRWRSSLKDSMNPGTGGEEGPADWTRCWWTRRWGNSRGRWHAIHGFLKLGLAWKVVTNRRRIHSHCSQWRTLLKTERKRRTLSRNTHTWCQDRRRTGAATANNSDETSPTHEELQLDFDDILVSYIPFQIIRKKKG